MQEACMHQVEQVRQDKGKAVEVTQHLKRKVKIGYSFLNIMDDEVDSSISDTLDDDVAKTEAI